MFDEAKIITFVNIYCHVAMRYEVRNLYVAMRYEVRNLLAVQILTETLAVYLSQSLSTLYLLEAG